MKIVRILLSTPLRSYPLGHQRSSSLTTRASFFEKADSAKLKDEKTLKPAGEYLQSHPFGLAVVAVYTGMKGDTDKDRTLAEARALAAREYLVKNFRFDDTRVKTAGIGKTAQQGDTVAVLIYPPGSPTAAAPVSH